METFSGWLFPTNTWGIESWKERLVNCFPRESLAKNILQGDYAVVLIDGNDAIFLDELLEDPKKGAREAAERIKQAVKVSLAIPILVNVYANVQNLAKTLSNAGVLKYDCDELHKFAQYFNDSNPEFNFINVGSDRKHKMSSEFLLAGVMDYTDINRNAPSLPSPTAMQEDILRRMS